MFNVMQYVTSFNDDGSVNHGAIVAYPNVPNLEGASEIADELMIREEVKFFNMSAEERCGYVRKSFFVAPVK